MIEKRLPIVACLHYRSLLDLQAFAIDTLPVTKLNNVPEIFYLLSLG